MVQIKLAKHSAATNSQFIFYCVHHDINYLFLKFVLERIRHLLILKSNQHRINIWLKFKIWLKFRHSYTYMCLNFKLSNMLWVNNLNLNLNDGSKWVIFVIVTSHGTIHDTGPYQHTLWLVYKILGFGPSNKQKLGLLAHLWHLTMSPNF